ncbi:D,D-heptose 1,7-bisphosphate phosphatase [Mycobacterium adipatum]|uniref:D,D-heptose 1,7-bisphosphate phosphatase n=1 Tax=Mycobacterium adipatum TaxID=1682113 RepID=A0A172USL9_9MYCO|nr:HAD family hydrolase [Mycobacterium adipatum]ANE82187.1 D,D-heptose 1,7-bisphosphate phosphatase [Mycobacterium adipatum]
MGKSRPAAFLDRDGVINVDRGFVGHPDDFCLVDGAAEAISLLNRRGYLVFVVTNQSGIGHGYYTEADFAALTVHMSSLLAQNNAHIDDLRHCPFHPEAKIDRYRSVHPWRKPAPGMILDLLNCWEVDVESSFLIGDSVRDVESATAAGIDGYLFGGGNLLQFVKSILSEMGQA